MELNQNISDNIEPMEGIEDVQKKSVIESIEPEKENCTTVDQLNESEQKLSNSSEQIDTNIISEDNVLSNEDLNNIEDISDLGDSRVIEGTESVNDGANSEDAMNPNEVSSELINNCIDNSTKDDTSEITQKLNELQNFCEKIPGNLISANKDVTESDKDNIIASVDSEVESDKCKESELGIIDEKNDDLSENELDNQLTEAEVLDKTTDGVSDSISSSTVDENIIIEKVSDDKASDEKIDSNVSDENISNDNLLDDKSEKDTLEENVTELMDISNIEGEMKNTTTVSEIESTETETNVITKDDDINFEVTEPTKINTEEKNNSNESQTEEKTTNESDKDAAINVNENESKTDSVEQSQTSEKPSASPILIADESSESTAIEAASKELLAAKSPIADASEANTSESIAPCSSDKQIIEIPDQDDPENQDDRSMEENPIFVHVSSKNEKNNASTDPEPSDDIMEVETLVEEDPIGVVQVQIEKDESMESMEETNLDKEPMKVVDNNVIEDLVSGKGADEELCIIPDTDREISQEEKDAATAAAAAANDTGAPAKPSAAKSPLKSPSKSIEIDDEKTNESSKNSIDEIEVNSSEDDSRLHGTISVVNHVRQPNSQNDDMKVVAIPDAESVEQVCQQCNTPRKCPFKVDFQGKDIFLCGDTCMISFRTLNKPKQVAAKKSEIKLKDMTKDITTTDVVRNKMFTRKCAECSVGINSNDEKVLSWETMEYCNEECLAKYQTKIGSHCANCSKNVVMSSLGKYCVRFGHDIRQFCCSICLEEFKKGLKVCSYCQKDISGGAEGFLAPVGDKGQFKDFCSQLCMENFDLMSNKNSNRVSVLEIGVCSVCTNEKQLAITFEQQTNKQKFCSEPCFVAFKFVNNVDPLLCDMCKKYFENDNSAEFSIYSDTGIKNFCCKTCQNIHIIANRRIVPCSWCKVKKYNFDMIKKVCATGQVLNMCSLNCLSLFQVSVNAVNAKKLKCDFCTKAIQAQYHLTMSDATLRNFCSYQCVISFQNQFPSLPITYGSDRPPPPPPPPVPTPAPTPAGPPRRNYPNTRNLRSSDQVSAEMQMPVITNVQSLANQNSAPSIRPPSERNSQSSACQTVIPPAPQIKQQVIIKAPPRPQMKNKSTAVKPITKTKAISCNVVVSHKQTQTDEQREKVRIVPIPVPIYVPTPMHMFSRPMPVPVPFPLPIPVPIFIPTTRNSAAGIMKEIKKIQVKIPTDPFEAELLMMAEMVAGEKKIDHTDSESDDDDHGGSAADTSFSPEAVDTSNTFGDDMLQMALKMATELDEPAVDLEGALTASTITATQSTESSGQSGAPLVSETIRAAGSAFPPEESIDDPQPMHAHHQHQLMDRGQAIRGRKRTVRQARGGAIIPSKRGRRMSTNVDIPMLPPPQPSQPPEPVEKPDANMCLKYTFGVNAWKQWVTTKNAELEKSSRRIKLFKNEILQLTADELNYSLCLFVKEVRKPNGTEYAPDTIYYLCLGIQQYLFENGRIDNIFTDAYYEKFTDCLDEVAKKFSVLYNDSHYIVTRVEEEHLWESKQLGAHSPHVLLSTLMFFNTKHFNLTTVDEHMQLSFSHIMKHWKRNPNQPGAAKVPGSRNVLLRFYPPQTTLDTNSRKKKVYEQQENEDNPLRCPVKLYEFYLSKCPESVKTRNDVFYLLPERSCVPDSPVWYSTMALGKEALEKMLHRVKMVKEINVALLTS